MCVRQWNIVGWYNGMVRTVLSSQVFDSGDFNADWNMFNNGVVQCIKTDLHLFNLY